MSSCSGWRAGMPMWSPAGPGGSFARTAEPRVDTDLDVFPVESVRPRRPHGRSVEPGRPWSSSEQAATGQQPVGGTSVGPAAIAPMSPHLRFSSTNTALARRPSTASTRPRRGRPTDILRIVILHDDRLGCCDDISHAFCFD